jgi:DNA modification methylase
MASIEVVLDRYHIWDSRNIAELLPQKEFIDVTVTSPPYWNLKDYGSTAQIGFGQTYDRYLDDLEQVFRAVYSATKETGSLWIISDTLKQDGELKTLPFDLAQRLKRVGWILQDIVIWNKDRTLPWSHQGKLRNIFEYIAFYSRTRDFSYHLNRVRELDQLREWWVRYPERYSPYGKAPARVWTIPIPRQGSWGSNWVRHFNPLPPQLVERILLLATNKGGTVLDPFAGSGAVLALAHAMGRKFIGLDLNENYQNMFWERVLPAIVNNYRETADAAHRTQSKRRRFARLISDLRSTKYPKELIRLHNKKHAPEAIMGILAIRQSKSDGLNLLFLFRQNCSVPQDFLAHAYELTKHPPLSKYGTRVVLEAHTADVVTMRWLSTRGIGPKQHLYVYLNGRTYAWAYRATAATYASQLHDEAGPGSGAYSYPPIVSNIAVRVDLQNPFFEAEDE